MAQTTAIISGRRRQLLLPGLLPEHAERVAAPESPIHQPGKLMWRASA